MKHRKLETTPEVSKRMANVHLKGGKAETALAKALWAEGVRYRKNYRKLPGSPDIAITKYKIAVFVDGEFWHGYDWENRKGKLKSNRDYWIEKIEWDKKDTASDNVKESIVVLSRNDTGKVDSKNLLDSAVVRERLGYMYPGEIIQSMTNQELRASLMEEKDK